MRIGGKLVPGVKRKRRNGRPILPRFRMMRLIAIASRLIGNPAERAAICHPDRERAARARHKRLKERRFFGCAPDVAGEDRLRRRGEKGWNIKKPGAQFDAPQLRLILRVEKRALSSFLEFSPFQRNSKNPRVSPTVILYARWYESSLGSASRAYFWVSDGPESFKRSINRASGCGSESCRVRS